MREYEKIETLWNRDTDGSKHLVPGSWRNETTEFLKDNVWEWTEKVDGTNVSVVWDGHGVSFHGRTEKAQMPVELVNRLNVLFGGEQNAQMFEQLFGEREVILYGEGYGRKIQNGGDYIPDGVDFILFDLFIAGNYQSRESVKFCADAFGIKTVPVVGHGSLSEAVSFVLKHPMSQIGTGQHEMEGVVCRPSVELRDRCGHRVIVKIKWNDVKWLIERGVSSGIKMANCPLEMGKQKRYVVREGIVNGMDNILRWYGNMDSSDVRKLQRRGLTRGEIIYWWEFDVEGKSDEEVEEIIATYFEEVC